MPVLLLLFVYFILFYFFFFLQIHAHAQRYCGAVSTHVSDFQMGENGWSKAAVSAIIMSVFGFLIYNMKLPTYRDILDML